jgi:predicted MPP superfamily phosphohydrolase
MKSTYKIDRSLFMRNKEYNVVKIHGEYTSLAKTDSFGNYLDDDFKIVAFTDMHLNIYNPKCNVTIEMLIRNISSQKPDLVVLVGDNITSSIKAGRMKQFGRLMEEIGVYWTLVLGNHEGDNAASISRQKIIDILASYPHCLVEKDIKTKKSGEIVWGVGNHVINLLDSKGEIRQSLYFIDSGDEMTKEDIEKYKEEIESTNNRKDDYIKDSQIQWYKETAKNINKTADKIVKSVIFCHIPLVEFNTAYEKALEGHAEAELLYGTRLEKVCSSGHNNGFFDCIHDFGSTQAFVSGHDHVNDYAVKYKGIILAYNQSSGYSCYNVVTKKISDTLTQGYTVYTIDKDGGLKLQPYCNAYLYPDLQEDILKLYN